MIYKYCKPDGFDILLRQKLRIARIENLNDPFEMEFGVDERNAHENVRSECESDERRVKAMARALDDEGIEYDRGSSEDIIRKCAAILTKQLKEGVRTVRENWSNKKGIICLSRSPDIIQMWAHYTDNHKGLVIGLDENQITDEKVIEVGYKDEMVLLPVTADNEIINDYGKYIMDVIGTKESNWGYEKEVRLYANLDERDTDGNYYIDIQPSAVKEIYLGLRSHETSEIIAKSIKQRNEYNHLKMYKMEKDKFTFGLVAVELP